MTAPLQWQTTLAVDAPPERVWAVVDDITRIPEYHPDVRSVELLSGTRTRAAGVRYRCNVPEGRKGSCVEEVTEYVPGSRFVTAFPEDTWGLSEQLANFTVEAAVASDAPGKAVLTLRAFYQPRGLITRLLNRVFMRRLMAKRAQETLAGIKRLVETENKS